jgi:RNA polymerase sigma-70 factor (family 1)
VSDNNQPYHDGQGEFLELFERYKLRVHGYIQSITGDFHVAEELTQEVFIRLWKKRDKYHEIENKDQYIFRMAHNASMNWFQKLALDARLAKEVKNRLQVSNNNVDDHLSLKEAQALLEKALETLSPKRREVFELSRKKGLKLQEIADEMGISFHTANHHLVAALQQIRSYFLEHSKDRALILLVFALVQ